MKRLKLSTITLILALMGTPAAGQVVRLSTENDILARSGPNDDLYTFSVAIEVQGLGFDWSLRENAFTDRAAGTRFDETYLSVRRPVPVTGNWSLTGEAGMVHVGEGIFGESAQNAVHRAVGSEEVELEYVGSSDYPRLAFTAARTIDPNGQFTWGPRLDVDLVPGFRSWALLSAEAAWRPASRFTVELQAGGRFTEVSYAALEPHIATSAPAGRVSVVFDDRIFVSWSYNDHGDEREHVSVGYMLALGGGREAKREMRNDK